MPRHVLVFQQGANAWFFALVRQLFARLMSHTGKRPAVLFNASAGPSTSSTARNTISEDQVPDHFQPAMTDVNDWLRKQSHSVPDPVPESSFANDADVPTLQANKRTLDAAMAKVALAVAALRRAGLCYTSKSAPFWYFAAGSWTRVIYDREAEDAGRKLPKRISVAHDVAYAEEKVKEAIGLLRREGDWRDARDLAEALDEYRLGGTW